MALPQHTTCGLHREAERQDRGADLCLSTPHAACIGMSILDDARRAALPQHTTCGLHPAPSACRWSTRSFASAHHMRLASFPSLTPTAYPLLCLSTPHAACIEISPCECLSATPHAACIQPAQRPWRGDRQALPQHTTCGLHRQNTSSEPSGRSLPQHTTCGLHQNASLSCTSMPNFASAHHMRLASAERQIAYTHQQALPQHHMWLASENHVHLRKAKIFASAHHMRLASSGSTGTMCARSFASAHHMRLASMSSRIVTVCLALCLSTPHAACIGNAVQILCRIFMEYAVSW